MIYVLCNIDRYDGPVGGMGDCIEVFEAPNDAVAKVRAHKAAARVLSSHPGWILEDYELSEIDPVAGSWREVPLSAAQIHAVDSTSSLSRVS